VTLSRIAIAALLADTYLPSLTLPASPDRPKFSLMSEIACKPMAALWMAGWLSLIW
jgi:hypothetical protein